jgi:hypothetical protein
MVICIICASRNIDITVIGGNLAAVCNSCGHTEIVEED